MFLGVALENAGTDQECRVIYGMHQCFGIVEDELASGESVFEPSHEVFGRWGDLRVRLCQCEQWFRFMRWRLCIISRC